MLHKINNMLVKKFLQLRPPRQRKVPLRVLSTFLWGAFCPLRRDFHRLLGWQRHRKARSLHQFLPSPLGQVRAQGGQPCKVRYRHVQ